jgi:hypothetical protein
MQENHAKHMGLHLQHTGETPGEKLCLPQAYTTRNTSNMRPTLDYTSTTLNYQRRTYLQGLCGSDD